MLIDFSSRPIIFLSSAIVSQKTASIVVERVNMLGGEVVKSPGRTQADKFDDVLSTAVASVIIVSNESASSSEQLGEWSHIQNKAWQDPNFKIIPILERGVETPPFLSQWQSIRIEDLKSELTLALDELLQFEDNTVELGQEQIDKSIERFKSIQESFESSAKSLPPEYSKAVKKYFDGDD